MNEDICDVCYKKKILKYRIHIPDGYLDVCTKKCGLKELKKWLPDMIEKLE